MKEKGFTLIELLAVIVILAIIALIATPIILNIIKDSKEESNKRSIEMYAKALQNSVAKYQLNGTKLEINKLKVKENSMGKEFENTDLKIDYDGNVVCGAIEVYKDGNVYLAKCKVNGENVEYTYGKKQSYDNGEIVYFDVEKGRGCTEEEYNLSYDETVKDYLNSRIGYNGYVNREKNRDDVETIVEKMPKQNSCLKFYAFNDDMNSETLNLLLDHNTTITIDWAPTNRKGPINAISYLKADTDKWKGTEIPQNYHYNSTESTYTIEYNTEEYKARLITAQEIAEITGADKALNFIEEISTNKYYFDGAKGTDSTWKTQIADSNNKSDYYWLFDRTRSCQSYGCNVEQPTIIVRDGISIYTYSLGYWTGSANNYSGFNAWFVHCDGSIAGGGDLGNYQVDNPNYHGIRPVIEVLKSSL